MTHRTKLFASLILGVFIFSCGGRALEVSDGDLLSPGISDASFVPDHHPATDGGSQLPPPKGCFTNQDCPASMYCELSSACVASISSSGVCKDKPPSSTCNDYDVCPWVCGCDNKTYCDPCYANAAGITVAADGRCESCDAIEQAYANTVQEAKACSTIINSVQCTIPVNSGLICGCTTYIEDYKAVFRLEQLSQKWQAQQCSSFIMCMSDCPDERGASCVQLEGAPLGDGICQDS